ncbi:hypothetical protein Tco_0300964 [Tanacetum coccineum]
MISVNNLKTDSENDYEKVMPSISSPEPAISYCDDLDFFKDFENEFPAIVYNDAQTSKSDLLTEPILNPQHIHEFDDLQSEKDKDDNDIDITQSLLDNEITHGSTMLFETSHDMALPPREQRHRFLRYEGLEYTDSDIADFESRQAMEHRERPEAQSLRNLFWPGITHREEMESLGFPRDGCWIVRLLLSSSGSSSTPSYSSEPSSPNSYSSGSTTPQNHQSRTSISRGCSNCKHLLGKIKVLEAAVKMHMHPEQHTHNSTALLHELYNDRDNLGLE